MIGNRSNHKSNTNTNSNNGKFVKHGNAGRSILGKR